MVKRWRSSLVVHVHPMKLNNWSENERLSSRSVDCMPSLDPTTFCPRRFIIPLHIIIGIQIQRCAHRLCSAPFRWKVSTQAQLIGHPISRFRVFTLPQLVKIYPYSSWHSTVKRQSDFLMTILRNYLQVERVLVFSNTLWSPTILFVYPPQVIYVPCK